MKSEMALPVAGIGRVHGAERRDERVRCRVDRLSGAELRRREPPLEFAVHRVVALLFFCAICHGIANRLV